MENYKIKVNNEAESKEAQELFFELGIEWRGSGNDIQGFWSEYCFYYTVNGFLVKSDSYGVFKSYDGKELTLAELRDLVAAHRKPTEQGLISGADALRALADGKEVECRAYEKNWINANNKQHPLSLFFDDCFQFRIKPRTITLTVEIPAHFEPKDGEEFYVLSSVQPNGYIRTHLKSHALLGAWKSEEEIKQVVAALRGALKNG